MNIYEEFEHTSKDRVYCDDPEIRVLELLNEYADSDPSFNSKFIDSCCVMLDQNGYLSGTQINKLIEIKDRLVQDLDKY